MPPCKHGFLPLTIEYFLPALIELSAGIGTGSRVPVCSECLGREKQEKQR
jgi:hypothetical protein